MLAERARSKTFRGCLQNQIAPDGLMRIEATRESGASYSTMNLRALFTLATVASQVTSSGEAPLPSLWTWKDSDGRGSIKAALGYLLPFATNQTRWPFMQDGISMWAKFPWGSLAPQLRIASIVYGGAKCEAAIAKLPRADTQWAKDVTQLLWPLPPTLELKIDDHDAEAGTCKSDLDCQLNDACRAGVCQCDTQWLAAPDCSQMKIIPKGRGSVVRTPDGTAPRSTILSAICGTSSSARLWRVESPRGGRGTAVASVRRAQILTGRTSLHWCSKTGFVAELKSLGSLLSVVAMTATKNPSTSAFVDLSDRSKSKVTWE